MTMSSLANKIEEYLKTLLAQSTEGVLELNRSDLADIFTCVPSQINYVLETRFNPSQGYYVESRRGGGGYVRIVKFSLDLDEDLSSVMRDTENKKVSQQEGDGLIDRLAEEGFLTKREGKLIKSLLDGEILSKPYETSQHLRGKLLHKVLLNIMRDDFEKEE